jgi:hypothetical protein
MIRIILLISFIAVCSTVYAENATKLLPQDLLTVAEKCNCEQISDFLDRPGMIEPSYVYGVLPGEKENSAVFWCRNKDKKGTYSLILTSRKNEISPWSYETIITTQNYPRGLSVIPNPSLPLSEFIYITNFKTHGPKGIKTSHSAISSYYDGIREIYYNYNGKWLIKEYD